MMSRQESGLSKGRGSFAGSAATLAGGTTLAMGLTILAEPITSRLFGPGVFGLAAIFVSGALIIARVAGLRYEMALVLPERDEDAAPLLGVCGVALLGVALLVSLLTWGCGEWTLGQLNASQLVPYLWVFPIHVFLLSVELPLRFWNTRHRRYKLVALGGLLLAVPVVAAQIIGGALGFRSGGNLATLRIIALTVPAAVLLWCLVRGDGRFVLRNCTAAKMKAAAARYGKFPLFDSWSILLNVTSYHVPVLLLAAYFSPSEAGLYDKAMRLLYLPSSLLGRSVGQVFLQQSAALKATGKSLAPLVEAVFRRMITFGALAFAMVAVIGPDLFGVFLGARWAEAGVYARILAPWPFVILMSTSIRTLFGTLEKQGVGLISFAVLFVLRVGILVLGGLVLRDVRLTLGLFALSSVVVLIWRCGYLMRAVGVAWSGPLGHMVRCLAYAAPSVGAVAAMKWWFGLAGPYVVVGAVVFSLSYAALVLRHDSELRDLLTGALKKLKRKP